MTINKSNLNLTSECYETMLQTMSESLFMVNQEGKIIFCNNAMVHLTGYSMEELMGNTCSLFMFCACAEGTDCVVFSQKRLNNFECQVKHKNGKRIPVLKNAQVMINKNNKTIGVIETLTDISKLKAVEKKLDNIKSKDQSKRFYEQIIGKSKIMQEIFGLLKLASTSNASILVLGETGTGKELVADAIHKKSVRKKKSLVKVNCSALSDSLLESELFGHVKGAFTGAYRHRIGRFETANDGDIFLDEIGDMPLSIQVKLLRVLEQKQIERVGDHQPIPVDARLITATNKNLKELIQRGEFREDFYFRINVIPIHVPTLRERLDDVPLLIDHFSRELCKRTGKKITGMTPESMDLLLSYSWPGNIRELKSVLEYAFAVAERGLIRVDQLPQSVVRDEVEPVQIRKITPSDEPAEKSELIQALTQANGNQSEAARLLDVSRVTVWNRMKKFNIDLKKTLL